MYKPIEVVSTNENVSETIRKSFMDQENSDFKIIVDGKDLHVHKTILRLRSKYFRQMFQENSRLEENNCSIEMKEMNYEATRAYLKYLYTDELEADQKVVLDVIVVAEKHKEENLVQLCVHKFEKCLDESNVAELYALTLQREINVSFSLIFFYSDCILLR